MSLNPNSSSQWGSSRPTTPLGSLAARVKQQQARNPRLGIIDKWNQHRPNLQHPTPIPRRFVKPADIFSSPSLFPRQGHAVSTPTQGGELYIFGGCTVSGTYLNDLWRYSTSDHSASLFQCYGEHPTPRAYASISVYGDILTLWGGTRNGQDYDDSLYLLDLVSHEWAKIKTHGAAPPAREHHAFATVDSALYIFGGRTTSASRLNDIWFFDLNTLGSQPAWELIKPSSDVPPPRQGHQWVYYENEDQEQRKLITFGGFDTINSRAHYYNDVWSFDLETRTWTELRTTTGQAPPGRQYYAATVVDDLVCIYGGSMGSNSMDDFGIFDVSKLHWHTSASVIPGPRYHHSIVFGDSLIYVLGGQSNAGRKDLDLVFTFNTAKLEEEFYLLTGKDKTEGETTGPDGGLTFVPSIKIPGGGGRVFSKFTLEAMIWNPETEQFDRFVLNINSDISMKRFRVPGADRDPPAPRLQGTYQTLEQLSGFAHFHGSIGNNRIFIRTDDGVIVKGDIIGGPIKTQTIVGSGTWSKS